MGNLRLLWELISKYRKYLGFNILMNILSSFSSVFSLLMLIPFLQVLFYREQEIVNSNNLPKFPFVDALYKQWIHLLDVQGAQVALLILCVSLIITFFIKNATRYLAAYFLIPVRTGVMKDLRTKIYSKLLSLDFGFYQRTRRGEIFTKFGHDVQEVEYGVINFIETGIKEPVTILITLLSLIIMSPYLTIWVIVLLPLSAFLIGKIGKQLKRDSFKAQYQLSLLNMMVDELMHGIRVIHSFKSSGILKNKFNQVNQEYRNLHNSLLYRKELASPLSEMLGIIVVAVILWIGGYTIFQGKSQLSPEVFITYIVVFSQIIQPAKAFSNAWYFIQKGVASLQRIQTLLAEKSIYETRKGSIHKSDFTDALEIHQLQYSFGNQQVLKNISLKISKGQKVAFVGPSGSGKTTLVQLLSGIYISEMGSIQIDGIDLNNIITSDYRDLFALVTQEPILFYGSIEENLLAANPNATEEEMIKALHQADALTFVRELPQFLNTQIGERGVHLSVGQQQRIALARAYLKNAPILILDEVSAALDGNSEKAIREAVLSITKSQTVVSIAHRLSTVVDYDQIYFLENGVITGQGTHEQLMQSHVLYAQMVQAQQLNL